MHSCLLNFVLLMGFQIVLEVTLLRCAMCLRIAGRILVKNLERSKSSARSYLIKNHLKTGAFKLMSHLLQWSAKYFLHLR
jgi:hypothetical protein